MAPGAAQRRRPRGAPDLQQHKVLRARVLQDLAAGPAAVGAAEADHLAQQAEVRLVRHQRQHHQVGVQPVPGRVPSPSACSGAAAWTQAALDAGAHFAKVGVHTHCPHPQPPQPISHDRAAPPPASGTWHWQGGLVGGLDRMQSRSLVVTWCARWSSGSSRLDVHCACQRGGPCAGPCRPVAVLLPATPAPAAQPAGRGRGRTCSAGRWAGSRARAWRGGCTP